MPKTSVKRKLVNLSKQIALNDLMFIETFCEDPETKKQKEEDALDDLLVVFAIEECCRYGVGFLHNTVPKSRQFLQDVLWNMDESRFKIFARVSKSTFDVLLDLIKDDDSFNGVRSCKQFPIKFQLLIVLYRLGSCGEGCSVSKMASLFGVGDGGTIQIITERVFNALLKHKSRYISWPNAAERKDMVSKTWAELPNCVGYVDGTEIPLAEKPTMDPESYFSRKRIYSMKAQAICDYSLRIRHLVLGYAGSVHDARIYNNCELAIKPQNFFSVGEWVAGDSAYKMSQTVITPYRDNSREMTPEKRKFFNRKFSEYRVRIEHCFGMLKERFNSLKSLKLQIKDENGIKKAIKWILCCVLLHNIVLDNNDNFDYELEADEDEDVFIAHSSAMNTEGEEKRKEIFKILLDMENC